MSVDVFYIAGAHTIPRLPDSTYYDNYIANYIWIGELEEYAEPKYYRVNNAIIQVYSVFRLKGLADDKYLESQGFDAEFIRSFVGSLELSWDGIISVDVDSYGIPLTYYETSQDDLYDKDTLGYVELTLIPDSEWRDIDDMISEMFSYWNDYGYVVDTANISAIYQHCETTFFFPCAKVSEVKKILNAICNYTATGIKSNIDKINFYWKLANVNNNPKVINVNNYEKIDVQYSVDDARITRITAYQKLPKFTDCYIDNEEKEKYYNTNSVVNQIYESKYLYNKINDKELYFPMTKWGHPSDISQTHGRYFGNTYEMLQSLRWLLSCNVENKKKVIIKTQYDIELNLGEYVILDSDYITGYDGEKVRKYFQVVSVGIKKDYIEYTLTESFEVGFKIAPDEITTQISDQYGLIAPDGCEYYENKYCAKVVCDWYRQ